MLLKAHDLGFAYGNRTVLHGASFAASTGEAVAIIGPSGVGKTTLLSLLGGLLRPHRGSITLDDESATGDQVAWVLQTVNVLPYRSVLENVALGALTDGVTRGMADRVAFRRLDDVGLRPLWNTAARKLSGGELQRVVIARSLASRRPFILADEPTGQLDRVTTEAVIGCLLATRADRGLVLVTHDWAVAKRCDRIYQLIDGRAVELPGSEL